MKCRPQVSPPWKKPAANGPWYQVLSNPVIPVESLVLASRAKWINAIAATSRAITVSRGGREVFSRHSTSSLWRDVSGEDLPSPSRRDATLQQPNPTAATSTKYGTGSHQPKLPRSSADQISSASAITALAQCAGAPSNRGSNQPRSEEPPSQAKPPSSRSSATPSRYRPRSSIRR